MTWVAAVLPKRTVAPDVKPEPVMTTFVPPALDPLLRESEVTFGLAR